MWKKILTRSIAVSCVLATVSCDKIESLVNDVTGDSAPLERRAGIKKMHQATIAEAEQWIAEPNVLVVLDFYSENCPPCKAMMPHLEALAESYGDKAAVMKLDVGQPGETATAAINEYGVDSTPILKFYLNGEEVKELKGARSKDELEVVFKKYTSKIDGEYTMREGDLPGMNKPRTVEEMMVPVSSDLPKGMARVKVPKEEKEVTVANPERELNKTLDQPTRLTAPVSKSN